MTGHLPGRTIVLRIRRKQLFLTYREMDMVNNRNRKARHWLLSVLPLTGAMLFTQCVGTVRLPLISLDINNEELFLQLPGGTVIVTDDSVDVDLPFVEVDLRG